MQRADPLFYGIAADSRFYFKGGTAGCSILRKSNFYIPIN
jgi:hypothetical protein